MIEFNIEAMTCGHCASLVTRAVKAFDPKAKVEIDVPAQKVRVESIKDRESLVSALFEAGYPPN